LNESRKRINLKSTKQEINMPQGYHHVTHDIRSQIYLLKSIGMSLHKIAKRLGKHVSTISREIDPATI